LVIGEIDPRKFNPTLYQGLFRVAHAWDVNVLGGDTTGSKGHLVINVTVTGLVPADQVLYRHAARPGDIIVMTGPTGRSAAGCEILLRGLSRETNSAESLVRAHLEPRPHVREARLLAHLERTTIWGTANIHQLYGSECLLVDVFTVSDQQAGCLRYSRYQVGSRLPRRFQCVPADNDLAANPVTPAFNSRRFGRPDYAQLHQACPEAILTGAENGSEMGAFQGALAALREKNLGVKLDEYLPVGLTPALIDVT